MVYARWVSELPTTFAKSRNAKKGELKRFDTDVKAREYAVRMIDDSGGVVMIYTHNTDKYLYAINNPLQNPHLKGYVDYKKHMGWHFWNIPDRKDKFTGEVYFKSRSIYKNGKMAGRF